MGLDSYARRTPNEDGQLTTLQKRAFANSNLRLCGGMFSGNGNDGSFRGKVYNSLIEAATGESLYQEWIPPAVVEMMYSDLLLYPNDEDGELDDLCAFFYICKEHKLGLVGWW